MAEALWRMRGSGKVKLITALGDDADGRYLAQISPGMIVDGSTVTAGRTPNYAAVLDSKGECLMGLGDMDLHNEISCDLINKHLGLLKQSPIVVLDGNTPQETVDYVLTLCAEMDKPVFFEPTDKRKALKTLKKNHRIKFASPNMNELRAMANFITPKITSASSNTIDEVMELSTIVCPFIETLLITLGEKGVIVVRNEDFLETDNSRPHIKAKLYPVQKITNIINVSGAGDSFASGFIYGMLMGMNEEQCINVAFQSAAAALKVANTVPNKYKFDLNITKKFI